MKEAGNQKDNNLEDLYEHHRIITDPKQSPIRIDKFLMDRLEKVTRNKIQNAIKAGSIRVNDKEIKANYKVRPNQTITILLPTIPEERNWTLPEQMDLDIVYEDVDVLVLNKPAGLVVHPGIGNYSGTLVNGLMYHFEHNKNLKNSDIPVMPGNRPDRPGLVHRIDKDTSGLMVIAKNEFAMTHLAKQFYDHTVERAYTALVWGEPEEDSGTITGAIGRHQKDRTQMYVYEEDEGYGKHAVTHFEVLKRMYYVSLVQCRLETGRTHQIRVHMKHFGHPLFNDAKYGGNRILKGTVFNKYKQFVENTFKILPRQALHARTIGFIHPVTGEQMRFDSELPEDMAEAMKKWENYLSSRRQR